jgi:hypothetical protein
MENTKSVIKNEFKISAFQYDDGKRIIPIGDANDSKIEISGIKSLTLEVESVGEFDVRALFDAFKSSKKVKIEVVND